MGEQVKYGENMNGFMLYSEFGPLECGRTIFEEYLILNRS